MKDVADHPVDDEVAPDAGAPEIVADLGLKAGEWVEVRPEAEILATLDEKGTLDGVPFMPEMLAYCGRRFRVYKRADKTCDTVNWTGIRRMERTVHLDVLRCNGSAHGGCQAGCLIFWKESWLKRAPEGPGQADSNACRGLRDRAWLETRVFQIGSSESEPRYRCQATELCNMSTILPWWEPTQYLRDWQGRNATLLQVLQSIALAGYSKLVKVTTGRRFPHIAGPLTRTPVETLNLQPGEWVVVKSKDEIMATLDKNGRNRGMTFDAEMLPYCGQCFRVLRRVERIIEETTGRMLEPPGVSIILDHVTCMSRYRRLCPRSIYPYWREIWLRRATAAEIPAEGACEFASPSCTNDA
jgi:hypothetical protein